MMLVLCCTPVLAYASTDVSTLMPGDSLWGLLAIAVFVLAYVLVIGEEFISLPKSNPVILAAGIIWVIVALVAKEHAPDYPHGLEVSLRHNLEEYAALFLFLLVAMTYINAMTERNVFAALRSWLLRRGFSYRQLFWITGFIAFFLSPIADNLTTALLMGAVVLAVGADSARFVSVACVNIVVAANAGGAFSPFGDITTLMVWQSGHASFFDFFVLFLPSIVNFLIPATLMSFAVPDKRPEAIDEHVDLRQGALVVCGLFGCTIVTAVSFEQFLHLPPFLGMLTGLSYLFFYAYLLQQRSRGSQETHEGFFQFTIFDKVAQAEWDTLFFFFGVIFCVGGIGYLGYLSVMSEVLYGGYGPTVANIVLGIVSAVIDNIPVMFAILTMNPEMDLYQWLLITLTAGVGGSLLSVGSAAGVALMGQARGLYTFFSHLRWSWAIALGYAGAIYTHYLVNG